MTDTTIRVGANYDPSRAFTRGLLGEALGPSPYRCCKCERDSRYGRDGLWFCVDHWIEARGILFAHDLRGS